MGRDRAVQESSAAAGKWSWDRAGRAAFGGCASWGAGNPLSCPEKLGAGDLHG